MNDMDTQVREALGAVGGSTPAPAFDQMTFRRKVRGARRRRTAFVAVTSAAAVGALAVSAYAVDAVLHGGSGGGERSSQVATTQPEVVQRLRPSEALTRPLFYTAGGRLQAFTPDGSVHDLGLRSEAVVGSTPEGVYAFDDESHLVWFESQSSGGGDGRYTFTRGAAPVDGAVQSAALSGDGRYLAWIALDDAVRVLDLETDRTIRKTAVTENSYVTAVAGDTVLVSEDGDLMLHTAEEVIPVPTVEGGYGWQSDVADDRVSVMDRDGVTRVYDVSAGQAELVVEVPGSGRLSPDGTAVVTAHLGGPAARLWVDDGLQHLDASGIKQSAGWLDEDLALLTSVVDGETVVQVCAVATRQCDAVLTSAEDVRLAQ